MLTLLLIFLLIVDTSRSLQCIVPCTLVFHFNEPFRIGDGQCKDRVSASQCSIQLSFNYDIKSYFAIFDKTATWGEYITIEKTPNPTFTYVIDYHCSEGTDCVLSYAQNKTKEMIDRAYNTSRIFEQLAPLIEDPLLNGSVQCYDNNNVKTCAPDARCVLQYNQKEKKVESRECHYGRLVYVGVIDNDWRTSLQVGCLRDLCNDDATLAQIKTVLANNRLTDANGRISRATQRLASRLLLILALIFSVVFWF